MARRLKRQQSCHRIRLRDDDGNGQLLLVEGGKLAYLDVEVYKGERLWFSGPVLRQLARAILMEMPLRRRQRKRSAPLPAAHEAALKDVLKGALRWARQDIDSVQFRQIVVTTAKRLETR
jgi:hypothetical protein